MSGPDDDAAAGTGDRPDDETGPGTGDGDRPGDASETTDPSPEPAPGHPSRLVTEGDLRSGSVSLLLLAAVVWLNDLPLVPVAGLPVGPAYAYVENRLLSGATQRAALLFAVVGALAAVAYLRGLAPAMWLALGATAGMQALGYLERWNAG